MELSNYGEVLLNRELLAILEHAWTRGVEVRIANGVNLNHAGDAVLEGLVRFGVTAMTVSIDGASEETYRVYRVGGSFERVIANVRRINHFKALHGATFPKLSWQFIAFGHNQHEIEKARALAAELRLKFHVKLSWDDDVSPISDPDMVRRETGAATRAEFAAAFGTDYMGHICHQLWDDPQINWDGRVLGCCRNFWGDFGGNAFADGLDASINGEGISHARAMLQGKAAARDGIPCTTCSLYQDMQKSGQWLKRESWLRAFARSFFKALRVSSLSWSKAPRNRSTGVV